MQGFTSVPDERLRAIRRWLRVAPAITAAWMLLGTLSQSPLVLVLLVPFSVMGALLPTHPFDVFYNHLARFVLGQPVLPENPLQRRVCCALASGWAIVTAILFYRGFATAGMVTGMVATLGCALPALTDFCVPSYFLSLFSRRGTTCAVPVFSEDDGGRRTPPWWIQDEDSREEPVSRTLYVGNGARRENRTGQSHV